MSSGRIIHELVDEPLAVHLGEDAPLVVIPQRPAHGLVVHVRLVLVEPPQPGHRLAVHYLEHAPLSVHPLDVFWAGAGGLQQGEEELPEIGVVIVFWSPGSCLCYHSVLRRRGRGRRLVSESSVDQLTLARAEEEGADGAGPGEADWEGLSQRMGVELVRGGRGRRLGLPQRLELFIVKRLEAFLWPQVCWIDAWNKSNSVKILR